MDFHAVMHWGEDAALEKHYVPRRSQRTRSVLTFFAQDAGTHNLVYANADISKATQAREVLAFCDHWRSPHRHRPDQPRVGPAGHHPRRARRTRRPRHPLHHPAHALDVAPRATSTASTPTAWKTVALDRDGNYRKPQVVDEQATITGYPGTVRQLIVRGLGRDTPTVIITNDRHSTAKQIIERYARRMTIEQRLAEAIRSFHLDALASAVPLNVDFDVVLSVLAGAVCASLRRRLGTGYTTATPDTLQRRFLSTGGTIHNHHDTITVRLDRRTYSPVLRTADIPDTTVPWWGDRTLHFEYA